MKADKNKDIYVQNPIPEVWEEIQHIVVLLNILERSNLSYFVVSDEAHKQIDRQENIYKPLENLFKNTKSATNLPDFLWLKSFHKV